MHFAIHQVLPNLGMKRRLHLRGRAAKHNRQMIRHHLIHMKPLRTQPRRHFVHITLRSAKRGGKLSRRQKPVKIRRTRILQLGRQGLQRRLLSRTWLQSENHMIQRKPRIHCLRGRQQPKTKQQD